MPSPTSSQLSEQGPSLGNPPISSPPRTPSPESTSIHQVTPEGNLDPTHTTNNNVSEPTESLPPSVSESAPNPGEAIPLVEKHAKDKDKDTHSRFSVVTIFSDIVAVVVPLAFISFMVVVWNLDGKPIEGAAFQKWQSAITVLATLFPILFATIVGRLMSEAARWKLEKGSRIGLLEQLMGSRTFGSTVQTFWTLRTVNNVGAALMVTWAFSPLGAQALLRMLSPRLQTIETDTTVTFFDTQASSHFEDLWSSTPSGSGLVTSFMGFVSGMYSSLIVASESVKSDALDLWGNVKIPLLPDEDNNNWQTISPDFGMTGWSSLAGIPIKHEVAGNKTFSIESTYIRLDCPNVAKKEFTGESQAITKMDYDFLDSTTYRIQNFRDSKNGTWHGYDPVKNDSDRSGGFGHEGRSWGVALDRFVDPLWYTKSKHYQSDPDLDRYFDSLNMFKNETGMKAEPTKLLLKIMIENGSPRPPDFLEATCDIRQKYVESKISCIRPPPGTTRHACRVTKQRPSTKRTAPQEISLLSLPKTFMYVSAGWPVASGQTDMSTVYLADPSLKLVSDQDGEGREGQDWVRGIRIGQPYLKDYDEKAIGVRLTQLLNTYLLLSQTSVDITGADYLDGQSGSALTNRAEATENVEQFFVSKTWLWLGIVSSIVLLIGGVLSVVFAHLARGPEILGYVSTIVRDSKFVEVPPNTSWLDGADLSRVIKDERVRHGFTGTASGEEGRHIGVGYQESTEPIGGAATHGK